MAMTATTASTSNTTIQTGRPLPGEAPPGPAVARLSKYSSIFAWRNGAVMMALANSRMIVPCYPAFDRFGLAYGPRTDLRAVFVVRVYGRAFFDVDCLRPSFAEHCG